jgi:diguanylate cyclase (GGDEF)-like protein/PAS domain S-box-containing protein
MLIYLFSNSQIDKDRYEKTLIDLLTFLEYDSRIKQQIVELRSGSKKNYSGLAAQQRILRNILEKFADNNSTTNLTADPEITRLLTSLQSEMQTKFSAIEQFKHYNAVFKNTLHYLPKNVHELLDKIHSSSNMPATDKNKAEHILETSLSKVYIYHAQVSLNNDQIKANLSTQRSQLVDLTPSDLHLFIDNTYKHCLLLIDLFSQVETISDVIISPSSSDITKSIYQHYNEDFLLQEKRAQKFRTWLFIISLLMLAYLAFIFFKLQRTSRHLKESLIDLEFLKYAIDQHCIVSTTNVKGDIIYANDRFCKISQYSRQELIGQNHRIVKSDCHDKAYFRDMWRTIAQGNKWHGVFANKAKDGSRYWVDSTILPRLNSHGKPYQYIGIRTDITAQKEAEQNAALLARFPAENPDPVMRVDTESRLMYNNAASIPILDHWLIQTGDVLPDEWMLICNRVLTQGKLEEHEIMIQDAHYLITFTPIESEQYVNLYARNVTQIKVAEENLNYQANHDPLTNLWNRFAFETRLGEALKQSQNQRINSVLLYIDLDQFKLVNDTCGHVAGDELLRQISALFLDIVRESDVLARLGGDEFGVILNNCNVGHGKTIARKFLLAINDFRFLWDDKSFEIGASIGLVEINNQCDSIINLLGEADIACYAAKDAGRNRIQVYHQNQAIARRKDEMQWVTLIPRALAENRFELYAQLIKPLNPDSGFMPHYELLIRLRSGDDELIPPGAFIPAAERYGLMHSIDMWVISHALELLNQHQSQQQNQPVRIAINLSGHSLGNEHILDFIPDMLQRYAIDASLITFEITETSAITNLTSVIKLMKELKALGCKFALDDFGSGLSSFAYLKNLPVDFLKIDGAFVKDILDDPIDAAMVQSINQIGHVMDIQTIAEFVESEKVEKRLAMINIDYAQGYGIEMPRPFVDILRQFGSKVIAKASQRLN